MQIFNRHERLITAPPERIVPLIADFDVIWPAELAPAPRPQGDRRYDTGLMVWEEIERPGAVRAFRVLSPAELQAGHWFELVPAAGGTLLRHTVEGTAAGAYEQLWPERIEPLHNRILEALLDNVQSAASASVPGSAREAPLGPGPAGPGGPRGRSACPGRRRPGHPGHAHCQTRRPRPRFGC